MGDAGEETGPSPRHGEVGDVADVAVEDRLGRALAGLDVAACQAGVGEGADHREGGEVDADRLQAGAADRLDEGGDHVAAGGDHDHVDLGLCPLLGGNAADHLVLEHGLVERHRDLLLGLEADRGVHLLRVLDRRQAHGADDDVLVADAEPHPLGELVLGEERLQRLGEAIGVEHLALVEDAGLKRLDRRCADPGRAVGALHLGRGDAARLDLEADDAARLLLPGQLQLHSWGRGAPIGVLAFPGSTERPQTFRPATTYF